MGGILFKKLAVTLFCLLNTAEAFADPDYFRLNLPNHTNPDNPQEFYCTATPNKTDNPRLIMGSRAQMVTGFKNSDPDAQGQLIIYANGIHGQPALNQVYFKAYQDPDEKDIRGFVQVIGTGEVDISCQLGRGENRSLIPGEYGLGRL